MTRLSSRKHPVPHPNIHPNHVPGTSSGNVERVNVAVRRDLASGQVFAAQLPGGREVIPGEVGVAFAALGEVYPSRPGR